MTKEAIKKIQSMNDLVSLWVKCVFFFLICLQKCASTMANNIPRDKNGETVVNITVYVKMAWLENTHVLICKYNYKDVLLILIKFDFMLGDITG